MRYLRWMRLPKNEGKVSKWRAVYLVALQTKRNPDPIPGSLPIREVTSMRHSRLKALVVPIARLAISLLLLAISITQIGLGQPMWLEMAAQLLEVGQSAIDLVTVVINLFRDKRGAPSSPDNEDEKPPA